MYIKKVQLTNVKGFEDLEFNFQRPDESYAGWTVIVGGNSSGKTTILKSIALSLMGSDAGRQICYPVSGWIKSGEKKAEAEVEISWDKDYDKFTSGGNIPGDIFKCGVRWIPEVNGETIRPLERRNSRGSKILTADRGPWSPKSSGWFSMGYGPMRRLSGSSSESSSLTARGGVISRFVTLFKEDAALSESEMWLRLNHSRSIEESQAGKNDMRELLEGVKALLNDGLMPYGMTIGEITTDNVLMKSKKGIKLPMRDISDGCRSMYATILDLIHGMYERYGIKGLFENKGGKFSVNKPAVVLIDEIEAHLHPSWQRDIPEWLKTHFPKVQFIVSTHSPLIAQAADENGIFVLPSLSDSGWKPRPLTADEFER